MDTDSWDKAFTLGFWGYTGDGSCKSSRISLRILHWKKPSFPASKIAPLGLGVGPANLKGAFVPKPKIFPRTHTYIRIESSKMSSSIKLHTKMLL